MVQPTHQWPGFPEDEKHAEKIAAMLQDSFDQSRTKISKEDILSAARYLAQSGVIKVDMEAKPHQVARREQRQRNISEALRQNL